MPFIDELLKYKNKYFLETGTYQGDTTQRVADSGMFETIYTIEYSKTLYDKAKERFQGTSNVHCFHGTSRADLWTLIQDIREPITFWLDAHWSGAADVDNETNICPVLEELEQIKKHPLMNHTIIIDDMRLMDGKHFPVTIPEIIQKLKEINPKYTLKSYADSETQGDILVAYYGDEPKPFAIHTYPYQIKSTGLTLGFGDFLRGTISMYILSKKYNYDFKVDISSHPFFHFLENGPSTIKYNIKDTIHELFPCEKFPGYYKEIYETLERYFKSGLSFSCITNSFLEDQKNIEIIPDDCRIFMKNLLIPNSILKQSLLNTSKKIGLELHKKYIAIHLRCGDEFLKNPLLYNPQMIEIYGSKLKVLLEENSAIQFLLVTDSVATGQILKDMFPSLCYNKEEKIHSGVLNSIWPESGEHLFKNDIQYMKALETTLIDFFLLSNSSYILSNSSSGFSKNISLIFGQPYQPIF